MAGVAGRPRSARRAPPGSLATCLLGENAVTFAYLDPGAGSLIASVLVGGAAAAGVAAKQARAKLGGFGRKKKSDEFITPADGEAAPTEATAPADAAATDEPVAEPADDPV